MVLVLLNMGDNFREVIISDTYVPSDSSEEEESTVNFEEFDLIRDVLLVKAILEFVSRNPPLSQLYRNEGVANFSVRRKYAWIVEKGYFQAFIDSNMLVL